METNQPYLPLPEFDEDDRLEVTVRQGLRQVTYVYPCRPESAVVLEFENQPSSLRHQLRLWWDAP